MNADNAAVSETEHIYIKNVESTVYTEVQSIDYVSNSSFFIFPLVIEVIACIQNVLSSFINLSTEAILGLESYWFFFKEMVFFSYGLLEIYFRSVIKRNFKLQDYLNNAQWSVMCLKSLPWKAWKWITIYIYFFKCFFAGWQLHCKMLLCLIILRWELIIRHWRWYLEQSWMPDLGKGLSELRRKSNHFGIFIPEMKFWP